MVKIFKKLSFSFVVILFFAVFSGAQAFAASFEASVDRNEIAAGQSFTLMLSLSNASAKSAPDFSVLEKDFTIVSRGQSTQTSIINGSVSSSINWQLTMIAPKVGKYKIPPVSIDTDAGTLKSKEIKITVSKTASLSSQLGKQQIKAISVVADISKKTPYQNEPVLYTVKLIAARNVADVSIPEVEIPDATVEKQGDAKIYDAKLKGRSVKVIEARYLITPLKSGTLKIPAFIFQGQVEAPIQNRRSNSLFNDPFFDMFGGISNYKPFAVASKELHLNVKAPAVSMDPWLPLYSLKMSDNLEGSENAKEGEPLTLSLTMVAQGAVGSILPSLESQISNNSDFKIYADKPETGETISDNGKTITGWREESYSLIPKKSGVLTLPEIKVPWWNITENEISYTTIPERKISVKLGEISSKPVVDNKADTILQKTSDAKSGYEVKENAEASIEQMQIEQDKEIPNYLYILLGVASTIIIILLGLVIYLLRKILEQGSGAENHKEAIISPANEDKISLSAVKNAKTAIELKNILQIYAHQYLNASRNTSLMSIYDVLKEKSPETKKLFSDLDASLYAGNDVDLKQLRDGFYNILKSLNTYKKKHNNKRSLKNINPS